MTDAEVELADNTMRDQRRLASLIKNASESAEISDQVLSTIDIEVRLEMLENHWAAFSQNDLFLQRRSTKLASRGYFKENIYESGLNDYMAAKAKYKQLYNKLCPPRGLPPPTSAIIQASGAQSTPSNQAELEALKLPTFDGTQRDWASFKDRFAPMILDKLDMEPVIKLQRLFNCLSGEALAIVQGISTTAENFQVAWDTLCCRYDNPQLRFINQMDILTQMQSANEESVSHLTSLLVTTNESVAVFKALHKPVQHWDEIFIYFTISRLPRSTRLSWARIVERDHKQEAPKLSDLRTFLQDRIHALLSVPQENDATSSKASSSKARKPAETPQTKRAVLATTAQANNTDKNNNNNNGNKPSKNRINKDVVCSFCQENHFIGYCRKFTACTPQQRKTHVQKAKLCENCLNVNHEADQCNSKGRCIVCGGKHNTKIHIETQSVPVHHTADKASDVPTYASTGTREKLLATARVTLQAANGNSITARAMIDSGATDCFVSNHIVQILQLKTQPAPTSIIGAGGGVSAVAKKRVSLILKSNHEPQFSYEFSALVLRNVTSQSPRRSVSLPHWLPFEEVELADPQFGQRSRIDCLLDTETFAVILRAGLIAGPPDTHVSALNTAFGYIILGALRSDESEKEDCVTAAHVTNSEHLDELLTRFWEIESVPDANPMSIEETACYRHFNETCTRNQSGRFVVRLPFKSQEYGSSTRTIAEACLNRLMRRFQKQPDTATAYRAFMDEYLYLNHMEQVPNEQISASPSMYLPHHPVFKNDGSRKIRVVFNASQKNEDGISLNSLLHKGPKLHRDVLPIIVRWSFFKYAFTCDIVKMFRQFAVHPHDCDWQRIVWRSSEADEIKTYRLTTVTYGTGCASFLTNACMLRLAEEEQLRFPKAAEAIIRGRYADDFFTGGDSLEEAIDTRSQLVECLLSAGLPVGKWAMNDQNILPEAQEKQPSKLFDLEHEESISALGIAWLPDEDVFTFNIFNEEDNDESTERVTKRTIASKSAKLFDPIGWISPVIIRAKILLQNLWILRLPWDKAVPEELRLAWNEFRDDLAALSTLKIPRWMGTDKNTVWHLHCFCDASERAYATALYAVSPTKEGFQSKLITAKARVAPTKVVSLPRLELCGALLLAELTAYLLDNLERSPQEVHCWSDSKVVLAWLQKYASKWNTFVATRVGKITTMLPNATWGHVKSADNPADLGSRGVTVAQLRESSLWWHGPDWLCKPPSDWPCAGQLFETSEELRNNERTMCFTAKPTEDPIFRTEWYKRFSSFEKIVRIVAYMHRFCSLATPGTRKAKSEPLTVPELRKGESSLLKLVQRESFSAEIAALKANKGIAKTSSLLRMTPVLIDGSLRVGGRLHNARISEREKHPVILPKNHHVTRLLILQAHKITMHGGVNLVQGYLLQNYWIIHARNIIRFVIRKCPVCTRHNARTLEQMMGPLPVERLTPARPFVNTGVDFCGPFLMRMSPGRGSKTIKGYVSIFVCMTVRAVHLEVVSDLTSDAFLAAFERFTSEHGKPSDMYSDNGSNFVGADAELKRLFAETSALSQEVAATVAMDKVTWHFNPPKGPNFGGLWETNVKSFKKHLRRTIGDSRLTFEEFLTVTKRIQGVMNSRPLCGLSSDSRDDLALTPGHFLIGGPLIAPPVPFVDVGLTSPATRWQRITIMRNHFWLRWHKEVLAEMQQRSKWFKPQHNFAVGDVVLFKDELVPPTKWPMARITKLYTGKDGLSRVADIATTTSTYTRPINRLILLPVNEDVYEHYKDHTRERNKK